MKARASMDVPLSGARVAARRKPRSVALRQAASRLLKYLLLSAVGLLFLFPWIWLISTSLKPPHQIVEIPPRLVPDPVMWVNYYYGVTSINFFRYLRNTLLICGVVVVGRLFSCTAVGYALSHVNWPGRRILF